MMFNCRERLSSAFCFLMEGIEKNQCVNSELAKYLDRMGNAIVQQAYKYKFVDEGVMQIFN